MSNKIFIYFSDLHLDVGNPNRHDHIFEAIEKISKKNINCEINILLAGDLCEARNIDTMISFFETLSPMVDRIFYSFGNHEYHHNTVDTVIDETKSIISKHFDNVCILENEIFEDEEFVIIGSVFWTNYDNNNVRCMKIAEDCLNDFNTINCNTSNIRRIKPIDIIGLHNQSYYYIENSINKYSDTDKTIIVMTHHSPINCHNRNLEGLDYAFCNEYENKIAYGGLEPSYWIFGHTHVQYDQNIGNCRILSNGLGYDHELHKNVKWFTI
ncbi:hypothetical protein PBI_SCTP2_249 [Salicola phage SCTP-2]|nr:hypothetical protein PBI_SCTP2_249 [Salicola phage SCTP-2]